jgi:hypothetical protein
VKRVAAVVDGFNLYHGIASMPSSDRLKWLDLPALVRQFSPVDQHVLVEISYFSAYATWDSDKERRHRQYVLALEASGVTPVLNHFKRKDKRCSSCGAKIRLREEKESDIGIITRLIELASEDQADLFLVISGDTDLRPGLVLFRKLFPRKQLRILFPPQRCNHSITQAVGGRQHVRQIEEHHLLHSQLPEVVRDSCGRVVARRPARYGSIPSGSGPAAAASLHLFGAATPTGEAFRQLALSADPVRPLHAYSRQATVSTDRADFNNPRAFRPAGQPGAPAIWISFGPIWLLAPFLEQLAREHPERLDGLRGLIACSSSSAITKRFAANRFDRELVARLTRAEENLLASCRRLDVPCRILRPTLIYGQAGPYSDRNLSRLLSLLRRLPVLPLPADTGFRQPIHARQLAAVALHLAQQLLGSGWDGTLPACIALGGDTTLSYAAMVSALQQAQPPGDAAGRCLLLPIPNRLFFALASPLLLRSPKKFEALLRMGANLAGFTPAHQLLGREPESFPLLPQA